MGPTVLHMRMINSCGCVLVAAASREEVAVIAARIGLVRVRLVFVENHVVVVAYCSGESVS